MDKILKLIFNRLADIDSSENINNYKIINGDVKI